MNAVSRRVRGFASASVFVFVSLVLLIAIPSTARAAATSDPCAALDSEQRTLAERVMAEVYPHECCDDTLATCLKTSPSRLVRRLAAAVCRRVAAGETEAEVKRGLERRAASMMPISRRPKMDLSAVDWAGDASAPVEIVAYVCARCPYCSKLIPALHTCVTTGQLKGIAKVGVRLFPIRGHEHSLEGGLAAIAALRLGRFWPLLLSIYAHFDESDPSLLPTRAVEAGLDRVKFEKMMANPATKRQLVASKKEGLRNKVAATPTLFINGKRYTGDIQLDALRDAIEEEGERVSGTLCSP